MNEPAYMEKDGKRLRLGYTTGSCAAAAAKAAAWMLLTGRDLKTVTITTPKGISLELEIREPCREPEAVRCAIRKDGGDDPDVTSGTLIFARVALRDTPGIHIDGGEGIGRVTKPGLDQPPGAAAINSVPRRMIRENVEEIVRLTDYRGGLSVVISAPEGQRLAGKTFNPRLGIVGGISILGTTGIVEPMSERALVDTIRVELRQRRETGTQYVLLTPGNYGSDYIGHTLGIHPETAVLTSNFIGDALDSCVELGFQGALLVGHIGKLVKLAGGMMNTHSRYGDCRMEILAALAGAAGLAPEGIRAILDCAACDEAVRILKEAGLCGPVLERLAGRIGDQLDHRTGGAIRTGAILFSKEYGFLCQTAQARTLLDHILEE